MGGALGEEQIISLNMCCLPRGLICWYRWEEVAVLSQVVVTSLRLVSELDLPDAQSEFISSWLVEGDGVDFPGLNFFLVFGEKVPSFCLALPLLSNLSMPCR